MSDFSDSNSVFNKPPKTKAEYSRNVKKLKVKLATVEKQIQQIHAKIRSFQNTSNDKIIALKISKFCKERRITPEMLYRCADRFRTKSIAKVQFKQTIIDMGLKLTQHQLTRLEYLLDEDVSGMISQEQYNSFLTAYRIKGEYSNDQKFLKDVLNKIDIIKIVQERKKQQESGVDDNNKKFRQLLTLQQFLKYCHRHLPKLKDKEIIAIFEKLQKRNLIDIDQFLQYMRRIEEEKRKLEQRNKKKEIKQEINTKQKSLKGIIQLLLKYRAKENKPIFHILEFSKLEKTLQRQKGQLSALFKQIDKFKKGSFGYDQLIQYFISKQKNSNDLVFVYEIMGRKCYITKEIPEQTLQRYNGGATNSNISLVDFKKYMLKQYAVLESESEVVFRSLQKKQNTVPLRVILEAMKLGEGQKKTVYVKPSLWKTFGTDFWKKKCFTILFNPFVALRFCLMIADELDKMKQKSWDDFEFGPTFQDPLGQQSIGPLSNQCDEVKWLSVESLGMKQFYYENDEEYSSSSLCPHDIFPKTVHNLIKNGQSQFESKEKINYNVKQVSQSELKPLFSGLYPKIFQEFSRYGLYVFRFHAREKWVYVLIDSKIPCNADGDPIFSHTKSKKYSWLSLVQKAYAKLKGNYTNLFNSLSSSLYIHEISRKLPVSMPLPSEEASSQWKNIIWQYLNKMYRQRKYQKIYSLMTEKKFQNPLVKKMETGIKPHNLIQISHLIQLKDEKCRNDHKSHRLIFVRGDFKNSSSWNLSWNSGEEDNKYDKYYTQMEDELTRLKVSTSVLKNKQIHILNYKLFRTIFDQIYCLKTHSFEEMNILRKVVDFEDKFKCRYEIYSKIPGGSPLRLVITLNRVKAPEDTVLLISLSDTKQKDQGKQNKKKDEKEQKKAEKVKQASECRKIQEKFSATELIVSSNPQYLDIKVQNWHENVDHRYILTFYISSAQYHLKQIDRQQLFQFVGPYEEEFCLDISKADQKQRTFIYRNYFKAAQRGPGCCG